QVNVGNDPQVVLDTMTDVIEKVVKDGVSDKDVERSKVQLLKHRELEAADTSGIAVGLSDWAALGDWRLYFLHRDRVEKVTAADVKAAAQKYLLRNNMTIGLFIPTDKAQRIEVTPTPALPEMLANYKGRADQSQGEEFSVTPAHIESRTKRLKLTPGVDAALLSKKTRGEVVELRLAVRYGNAASLAKLSTACEFLPELMARGTKKLSRAELQDELDLNRATLSAAGMAGVSIFTIQTKRSNFAAVIDLLKQVLREPKLDASELDVLKNRHLATLEGQRNDPQALASRTMQRMYAPYPPTDVRYVATVAEEIERVKALDAATIQKLYADFLSGQAVQMSVVGDFDEAAITPKLKDLFADWKAPQSYARIERSAPEKWVSGTLAIETPDKANAVYYSGLSLPMKDDNPDYPALVIGDYILGAGALSSRLGDRIRQREGLSYGVRSSFTADAMDPRASISVMAICNPANIGKVETAVREEIELLLKSGPTAEELTKAKAGYLQRAEVSRTDDSTLAQQLNTTLLTGRTLAFQSDIEKKIAELTPEQVVAALRKYVDVKKLYVVTAGDFAKQKK
ncbi:MAG: peptidase domain protein, partial [Planctomycetaceae bacterium]|nr:peptidase domain protein [Planctomycetaceae bacterium]